MANIATITNNIISALSGTTSQVLLGDATLTDFKLDSLTDVSVPTPGDGDVLKWNGTTSLWEASDSAGITGSGTANYIPKFTSAGVLGNSQIFDNGTNIGIGTASPTTKLHVAGSIYSSSNLTTLGGITVGMTPAPFWNAKFVDYNDGSGLYIGSVQAGGYKSISGDSYYFNSGNWYSDNTVSSIVSLISGSIRFYTNSGLTANTNFTPSERMRITSAGDVGIGTTTPAYKLDVNGVSRALSSTIVQASSNADTPNITFTNNTSSFTWGIVGGLLQGDGDGALYFSTKLSASVTEKMRITSAGNVGIGTTAPAYKFEVQTSGISTPLRLLQTNYQSLTVEYPALYTTQINFAVFGRIEYDGNGGVMTISNRSTQAGSSSMGFVMGTTERMRITDTGNVGIGITTPATKLEVFDSVTTQLRVRMSGQADMRIIADTGYGAISNDSNMPLVLRTNATERMRIDGTGNVGIGTSNPTVKLHIAGTATNSTIVPILIGTQTGSGADTGTSIRLGYSDTAGAYAQIGGAYANAGTYLNFSTSPDNSTAAVERIRITAGGNVGIGTTTGDPFSRGYTRMLGLSTSTASGSTAIQLNGGSGGYGQIDFGAGGIRTAGISGSANETQWGSLTAIPAIIYTNSTERMRLTATGDLLVGTTTSAGKLSVSLSGAANQRLANFRNTGGNSYIEIQSSGAGAVALWAAADNQFSISQNATAGTMGTSVFYVNSSGNVGIGNTNPLQKLDVNGDALINGVRVGKGPNSLSGNTVLGASALNGVTTGTNNVAIGPNAIDGTTTGNYNIAIGFFAGGIGAAENTTGSQNIFIGTETQGESSTESNRTWIGGNTTISTWLGGNLLLGTKTNSTYRLDVVGAGRISNGLLVSGGVVSIQTLAGAGTAIVVTDNAGNLSTQPTTTYLTSLTGEATSSGGGATTVTLTNSAVIGKVLTGLNINSAAITASDSILSAFGKIQGQIDGLQGGTIYKGSWNASTNTPTITSGTGTQGNYYVVTTAGTTTIDGVSSWAVGDWIIFNGTVWEKIPNVDAITSVNGQTGVVSLTTSNINEGTNLYYTDARARAAISLTTSGASGAASYSSGVLNIPTYTLTGLGGVASTRTITINGTALDLSADRTYNVGTVTSIVAGSYLTGGTITGSGTIAVDATTTNTANKVVARDASGNFSAGTITANLTGTASNATSATNALRIVFNDGPRNLSDRLPNSFTRTVNFDFVTSGTVGGTGNYAGVMSFSPWVGDTASTGDSSYQLAFMNQTSVNGAGLPGLRIRKGIDTTWGDWYTLLHAGNYNSYSPTLTGTGASGTWAINITGNSATATISSQVTINYSNNSDSSYQMLWGSGNSVYGTAGITCNPFTDAINLTGTLYAGGLTINGFGRMYGGDFWHSGTANNGGRTPTIKLGKFSDQELPAYTIYTDDSDGDILEFYSERFNGDFRLTRNSGTGLRNMMRVSSQDSISALDLYDGGGSTISTRINTNGNSYIMGGNVGIGNNNPTYKLEVSGTTLFSHSLSSIPDASASSRSTMTFTPSSTATNANSYGFSSTVTYVLGTAQYNGNEAYNAAALFGQAVIVGSTTQSTQPIRAVMAGLVGRAGSAVINISDYRMFDVKTPDDAGLSGHSIGSIYGLKIGTLKGAAGYNITNGWGVYQEGVSDNNYFRGKVLIGTTSVGGSPLRLSGLPTSSVGLSAGDVWNSGGTLRIV